MLITFADRLDSDQAQHFCHFQTIGQSDGTCISGEKNQQMTKKHAKLPSRHRRCFVIIHNILSSLMQGGPVLKDEYHLKSLPPLPAVNTGVFHNLKR